MKGRCSPISIEGVHFFQVNDAEQGELRLWLEEEVEDSGLPAPYAADNILARHVERAVKDMCLHMTAREHITADGRPFQGVSYIADDDSATVYARLLSREKTVVIVVGAGWLFRLVKIVDGLNGPLKHRPRAGTQDSGTEERAEDYPDISALLVGSERVTEREALEIVASWPSPEYVYTETDLGPWAVFYDLARLIWCHEIAHGLCGHTEFCRDYLRLPLLGESSPERKGSAVIESIGGTKAEVLQCQEMHADEFSVRFNLLQILYGHDPAGLFVASRVDLVDRLLLLNSAFCVFALLWALEDDPSRSLPWKEATHPPVGLRYDRFRGFQRDIAMMYDTRLLSAVDVCSYRFLERLGRTSPYFLELEVITPLIARTPTTKSLVRYEEELMRLGPAIEAAIQPYVYFPTKEG